MSTLAERLKEALAARQISMQGLDGEAKLPRGYASRVTRGERLSLNPDMLRRIATVLRINYEWLAIGSGARDIVTPSQDVGERRGPDPLPNRAIFATTPEFKAASPRVRAWFLDLAPREGDKSIMQWAEVLEIGKRLDAIGMLSTRGADEPLEVGIVKPKRKKK